MGYDRLTLQFSRPLPTDDVRQFVLKGKRSIRFVYDFFHTRLASRHLLDGIRYNPQRLLSIRLSQYRKSTVRLVIETPEPYATEFYPMSGGRYTLALPKGSSSLKGLFAGLNKRKNPTDAPRRSTERKVASAKAASKKKTQKNPKTTRRSNRALKQLNTSPSASKGSRLMHKPAIRLKHRYTVILDPGHGGHDTGALDPTHRYQEKRAILAIARRVRAHLKAMGFRVLMTRSSDRFIKLHRRTRYANLKHGDIFVSIHANAVGRLSRASQIHGIETYYLSPARSARARRVAAKENSIAFRKYYKDSMNVYLRTLTRSKIVLSNKLALDVQRSMLAKLRKKYRGVVDGGVRPAPFWVLVGAEMPAILVETGYITHPWEKKRLYNSAYQDLLARGIAEGVARFLANRERELE
ncbi:N-acetylmuramoyl-L-alanine amidase family protein [Nitratifractor sp.]